MAQPAEGAGVPGGDRDGSPTVVVVAGTTHTSRIDGISAAGASPAGMLHTPSADLEIVLVGEPVAAPVVPVSPTGCPTPAVVTRAARELLGFETRAVAAGLARPAAVPTVTVAETPGGDIRSREPVPAAAETYLDAVEVGRSLATAEVIIGETIPGGTTTALAVLTALGERPSVSSSRRENPLALKRRVVADALDASGIAPGGTAGAPIDTLRQVGDPVLAAVAGLTVGAVAQGTAVTLAGGTQLAAAAAIVRHAGVDAPLSLATTAFVAADETAAIEELAVDLDLELTVTDPGFDRQDHPAFDAYAAGEAKEGVGMGGTLELAARQSVPMARLRERIVAVYDRLMATRQEGGS